MEPGEPDPELWREANECLCLHGHDAAIFAAQEADAFLENGDLDGAKRWRMIVQRINMLRERPYGPLN